MVTAAQTGEAIPWWLDRVFIPILFTLLGAVIGFATGQLAQLLEGRKTKRAFMRAIRMELYGLEQQLQASLDEVEISKFRLQTNPSNPPQLVGTLRTTVFTTQLGKLHSLSDPLLIEIVKFYSDLPVLQQTIEHLNRFGAGFTIDDGIEQLRQRNARVLSVLQILFEQLQGFLKRLRELTPRLPA